MASRKRNWTSNAVITGVDTGHFSRRQLRGLAILAKGGQIQRINDSTFNVKSQSTDSWYAVMITNQKLMCSCPDFKKMRKNCKHIFAASFLIKWDAIAVANGISIPTLLEEPRTAFAISTS